MNTKKDQQSQMGIVKRAGGLLSRDAQQDEPRHVINYYHTGDVNVQIPVYLAPSASVVGNITSPKVVVAGKLFGVISADTVVIEKGGHIWGDIYTSEVYIDPGGKNFGWIISLDTGTIELLRSGDLSRNDLPGTGERPMSADFRKEHAIDQSQLPVKPDQQKIIFQHFQAELAAAQMARIEIELSFEERLAEALRQSEVHLLFDTEANESKKDAGRDEAAEGGVSTSTAITIEEHLQLEREVQSYKQKTEACLEQINRFKLIQAAANNELEELMGELSEKVIENDRLKQSLVEMSLYELMPPDDNLTEESEKLNQLKADVAQAKLKIIELEADLAYYRHLSRGFTG